LVAQGGSSVDPVEWTEQATAAEQLAAATAYYQGAPPVEVTAAIEIGVTLVIPDDQPQTISTPSSLIPDANGYEPPFDSVAPPSETIDGQVAAINGVAEQPTPSVSLCGGIETGCPGQPTDGVTIPLVNRPDTDPPAGVVMVINGQTYVTIAAAAAAEASAVAPGLIATCIAAAPCLVIGSMVVVVGVGLRLRFRCF
jgi:hypothetical protein